jgi:hypothetical protein
MKSKASSLSKVRWPRRSWSAASALARATARAIWPSRKSLNAMPWAFSDLGYSDAAVMPGRVLISRKIGPFGVTMKSLRE